MHACMHACGPSPPWRQSSVQQKRVQPHCPGPPQSRPSHKGVRWFVGVSSMVSSTTTGLEVQAVDRQGFIICLSWQHAQRRSLLLDRAPLIYIKG
jgi:hypothetical protein